MFSGSSNNARSDQWNYCLMYECIVHKSWRPLTGGKNDITYSSASIHHSHEIPTAVPMFSGSGNKARLLRRLLDAWICWESKMVHINLRLTDAIFKLHLIHTSGSLCVRSVSSPTLADVCNVPMTASFHVSTTTPGTYYDLFCRQPEMITITCTNVTTTYSFLQRHNHTLSENGFIKRMLYKNTGCDRLISIIHSH